MFVYLQYDYSQRTKIKSAIFNILQRIQIYKNKKIWIFLKQLVLPVNEFVCNIKGDSKSSAIQL